MPWPTRPAVHAVAPQEGSVMLNAEHNADRCRAQIGAKAVALWMREMKSTQLQSSGPDGVDSARKGEKGMHFAPSSGIHCWTGNTKEFDVTCCSPRGKIQYKVQTRRNWRCRTGVQGPQALLPLSYGLEHTASILKAICYSL